MVFLTHINEGKLILRTYEPTSGFSTHGIKEKNDIAHLWVHKWFFHSHK